MIAVKTGLQLTRLGLGLGVLGAAVLAYGAGRMVLASRSYQGASDSDHRREKVAYLFAAILFFAGFALGLVGSVIR